MPLALQCYVRQLAIGKVLAKGPSFFAAIDQPGLAPAHNLAIYTSRTKISAIGPGSICLDHRTPTSVLSFGGSTRGL